MMKLFAHNRYLFVHLLFIRLLDYRFESRDAPVSELDNNRAGLLGAAEKIM
jgi:hypothetical protein